MGGLTGAVHWWEESQLRVLVLSSMAIQFFLFFFSYLRRMALPGWFRFIAWLVYLSGDAVAIYALATLFNRHKADEDGVGGSSSSTLEVVWAPVLLLHLGGLEGITAYNIEDNELWSRHLLTAVSQITVAIYAFCKSWPSGGDKKLLQVAILLFVLGVLRCLDKPWAFKGASIRNLVSSSSAAVKQNKSEGVYTLEEYVKLAKAFVGNFAQGQKGEGEAQGNRSTTVVAKEDCRSKGNERHSAFKLLYATSRAFNNLLSATREERKMYYLEQPRKQLEDKERDDISKLLFVDLSCSYSHRLNTLKRLWSFSEERTYGSVREGLSSAFLLLYTRLKTSAVAFALVQDPGKASVTFKFICQQLLQTLRVTLAWAAIGLFHKSHREDYNDIDVRITYALFCCTAVLESYSIGPLIMLFLDDEDDDSREPSFRFKELWPQMVAQYSLMQFFARNKRHKKKMRIVSFIGCKDFLDQHLSMKPCSSSERITKLVLGYLKHGWEEKIQDVSSYLRFNDYSSHWVREYNHRSSQVPVLVSKRKRSFDESVLLWHMATDFCFFLSSFSEHKCAFAKNPTIVTWTLELYREIKRRIEMEAQSARGTSSFGYNRNNPTSSCQCSQESTKCKAVQCRQMSNYMMYLLFVNPEMLLPGTRRNLFTAAYDELKDILPEDSKPSLFATAYKQVKDILLEDNKQSGWRRVTAAFKEMKDILRDNKRNPLSWSQWKAAPVKEESLMERLINAMPMLDKPTEEPKGDYKENFINDAWILAQRLLDNYKGDEKKMWEEIEKVWVEMLCFSASRCRGYLHAKALGNGGEFLSYIWLLLFYMGMETFTDKLQRQEHTSSGGNNSTAPPSASDVSANPSPSSTTEVSTGTALSPLKIHVDMAQSTSEIRMAAQDTV